MGVRAAVWVVVMVVVTWVAGAPQDDITLVAGGYSGVTVSISDQLDEAKCTQYINSTKAMIEAASQLMFSATDSKVFFSDVVIVVPEQWACEGSSVDTLDVTYTLDSTHIRVSPAHHLFGDNPWTQQPGACGYPGDWIYVSENFLLNKTSYGSQGSVLVHEWAKYRWGVFEEYGHTNDIIYPPLYLDSDNAMAPNYCTDQSLEGIVSCSDGGVTAECQFTGNSSTVTSSLLSVPFLDTVVDFCNGNTHNAAAPTKHNLLCGQRSVWDVMNNHSDIQGTQNSLTSTTFKLVRARAKGPRMVLLLDYSSIMNETRARWEQLHDNANQFILTEAASEIYMGLVVFGSGIVAFSQVSPLSVYDNRVALAAAIPEKPPSMEGDKNLQLAISRGTESVNANCMRHATQKSTLLTGLSLQETILSGGHGGYRKLLGAEGGTLVLVTHNLEEYTNTEDLTGAAANNPVWPILYPCDGSLSKNVYDQLAGISPDTSVLTVIDETYSLNGYLYQSIQNSADLHQNLMTAVSSPATQVTSNSCTQTTCNLALQVTDSSAYISTAHIKVFYNLDESPNYFKITVTAPSGEAVTGNLISTTALFEINSLQTGQYKVSITGSIDTTTLIAELWATPATPLGLEVSVWSSYGLDNLQYLPGIAPTLFAKVTTSDSSPVLFADVTGKVTQKDSVGNTANITLNDAGSGGDVTGNDGIYSGYLMGFEPNMDISISLTVTDNNGAARIVTTTVKAAPSTPGEGGCCGSELDLSGLELTNTGNFTFTPAAVSGRLTGQSPGTFPPGRVMDLQGSRSGYEVTLTFTAPGAQLDQGTADGYEWRFETQDEEPHVANFSGHPAGSLVELTDSLPNCDKVYTMTIVAINGGVRGATSNSVREIVSCSEITRKLSAGAIAGITIGCLLGVLLILLIIYLCLNRDHLDELRLWQILTCRCCRKEKEDLYKQPTQARRTDVIRNNTDPPRPVRELNDLYTRPNLAVKKERRQNKSPDEDDGGFGERRIRPENMPRKTEDVESVASSHSTLAINTVGLPVGSDNHGYDDDSYTIYKNVPAPVRYPRANTQV